MNNEFNYLHGFGKFRLDAEKKFLWYDEKPVQLPLKAIELLCVLVENNGALVTKDEIWQSVWQDSFVEETNLTHNIYLLRKIFKDFGEPDLIQTVPRRGYRFAGEVREIENCNDEIIIERHALTQTLIEEISLTENGIETHKWGNAESFENQNQVRQRLTRKPAAKQIQSVLSVSILAAVFLIGAAAFSNYQNSPAKTSASEIKSIAVLPFKMIGGETDGEHRGLALADVLISRLSSIRELKVRPTSAVFNLENQEISTAGEKLKVDAVLEGTIYRADDKVRVIARLVTVGDNSTIWSGQFAKLVGDEFNLQDEIALQVVDALALNLSGGERDTLTRRYTSDADAFGLYQKARFHWNKRNGAGMKEAERLFRNAVERDPNFALARVGLADTIGISGDSSEAFMQINTALRLDPNLAEARATHGFLLTFHKWQWREAEAEFKKSIELNPNYATAHHWYAQLLAIEGRFDEAKDEMCRALDINPLSHNFWADLGQIYYFNREYREAKIYVQKALEIYPKFIFAHEYMTDIHLRLGEEDAAFESLLNVNRNKWSDTISQSERNELEIGLEPLKELYKTGGFAALTLESLKEIEGRSDKAASQRNVNSFLGMAVIYYSLGDKQKALDKLEEAHRHRAFMIVFLKASPNYDSLRDEPRFQKIVRRMNL